MDTVTGQLKKGTELPIKRLYLDGLVLHTVCKKCQRDIVVDLATRPLDYPKIGLPELVTGECDCGEEYGVKVYLNLHLTTE